MRLLCAVVVSMAATAAPFLHAAPPAKPNVLLIITDQQHAGMLSAAGNPYVRTPALDRLAATGARFERAYCGNPVCVPSRFGMFTGVMPSRIGMRDNSASLKVPAPILANSMGKLFRAAGYETMYGGKLHTPMKLGEMGFDLLTTDQREELATACVEYLRKPHDRPFLLVASFINPHDICYMAIRAHAQAQKAQGLRAKELGSANPAIAALDAALALPAGVARDDFFARLCPPLPANFEIPEGEPDEAVGSDPRSFRSYVRENWKAEDWRLHRWAYARLTERVDGQIGQVLDALRSAGREDDTVVVFTSDHGDLDSAHRLEHKSMPYDEASRVPLLVRGPGITQAGLVDRTHLISTTLDLIPTLCDFAGIDQPAALAGRSVRPLAAGKPPAQWRPATVVEGRRFIMVRSAKHKYTVYAAGTRREQLTDMETDPGEMHNLAADPAHATVLAEHRKLLVDWYRENGEALDPAYIVK